MSGSPVVPDFDDGVPIKDNAEREDAEVKHLLPPPEEAPAEDDDE